MQMWIACLFHIQPLFLVVPMQMPVIMMKMPGLMTALVNTPKNIMTVMETALPK